MQCSLSRPVAREALWLTDDGLLVLASTQAPLRSSSPLFQLSDHPPLPLRCVHATHSTSTRIRSPPGTTRSSFQCNHTFSASYSRVPPSRSLDQWMTFKSFIAHGDSSSVTETLYGNARARALFLAGDKPSRYDHHDILGTNANAYSPARHRETGSYTRTHYASFSTSTSARSNLTTFSSPSFPQVLFSIYTAPPSLPDALTWSSVACLERVSVW